MLREVVVVGEGVLFMLIIWLCWLIMKLFINLLFGNMVCV